MLLIWDRGKPAEFWIRDAKAVESFIRTNKLRGLPEAEFRLHSGASAAVRSGDASSFMVARDWCGGLRHPHLHHGEMVYPLDQEQWKMFAQDRITNMADLLRKASTPSFGHFMEVVRSGDLLT